MISLDRLPVLIRRLERLDVEAVQEAAMGSVARQLSEAVRAELSTIPGAPHGTPWLRSGELRESVGISSVPGGAVVGSTDPVAVFQELGTAHVPPRPFLAPAAQRLEVAIGQQVAEAVRAAIADALAGT